MGENFSLFNLTMKADDLRILFNNGVGHSACNSNVEQDFKKKQKS